MSSNSSLNSHLSFHLTTFRAAMILLLLIASMLYGLVVYHPLPDAEGKKTKDADLKCYQTIAEKIHAGESYYSAAGQVLRKMGYTTASVFNWRLPPLAWILGNLPSLRAGQIISFILAITTLIIWMTVFHQNRYVIWQIILGGLILSGPVVYSLVPGPFLAHEFWAGTLIALSLAASARGWRYASVAAGLAALFLRELSLPFVFVMMILAFREGQRREALLWFIGILCFGGELLIHWSIVSKLITANDKVLEGGWIVFGGWPFVLTTAQMHPFLLMLPSWMTAIILPMALLGLTGWGGASGLRITCAVGIYVLAFMFVGRSFNLYWGLMYAFVMPLGLLHLPFVFNELRKHLTQRKDISQRSSVL